MTTEVEICNNALTNIRGKSILSLNEASREAQLCKLKYPKVRDRLLREINWSFATVNEPLVLLSGVTLHRWALAYKYPNDCLKVREVTIQDILKNNSYEGIKFREEFFSDYVEPDYRVPYEKLSKDGVIVIGCDTAEVVARYTRKVTNPGQFDSLFVVLLEWALAKELAIPLMGIEQGRILRQEADREYNDLRQNSVKEDDEENGNVIQSTSEFERARL